MRDNVLGRTTQVNIFFAVVYIKGPTPALDTWWACLAARDINAPPAPDDAPVTYPRCVVIDELPKVGNEYPRVEDELAPDLTWRVRTALLYHPEPVPVLDPPLLLTFNIDLERYRQTILRSR
jgi:hypothetical protein